MSKRRIVTFIVAVCMVLGCVNVVPMLGAAEESAAVFVNETLSENGDGTADSPYNTFAAAVSAIKSTGGTIVVCGQTKLASDAFKNVATDITVTSKYGGSDYRGALEGDAENGYALTGAYLYCVFSSPIEAGTGTGAITFENVNYRAAAQYAAFNFGGRRFTLGDGVAVYEPTTNSTEQTNTRLAETFQMRYLNIGTQTATYGDMYGKVGRDTSVLNLYLGARANAVAESYLADIDGNVKYFYVSDENKDETAEHLTINGDVKINLGGSISNITVSSKNGVSGLKKLGGSLLIAVKNGAEVPNIASDVKTAAGKWIVAKSVSDDVSVRLTEENSLYAVKVTGDYNCVSLKNASSENIKNVNLSDGECVFGADDLESGIYTLEPSVREFYTATFVDNGCGNTVDPYIAASDDAEALTFMLPSLENSENFEFAGWSLTENSDIAEYAGGAQYTLSGSTVFYAVWSEREKITVTFKDESGKIIGTFSGMAGTVISDFPDAPQKEGYRFLFWSCDGKTPVTVLGEASAAATPVYEYTGIIPVYLDGTLTENGDGKTPETAYNSFESAMNAVITDGGTIVVCGATEMKDNGFINKGDVTFTSVDPNTGKDYRGGLNEETNEFSGAYLSRSEGSPYTMASLTAVPSKVVFERIDIVYRSQYSAIMARGRSVVFGDEVCFYEPTVNNTSCTTFRPVVTFSFRLYESGDETGNTVYTENIIGKNTVIPYYQLGSRKNMTLPGHSVTVNGEVGRIIFAGDLKSTDGNHGALTLTGDVNITVNGKLGKITDASVKVGETVYNGLGTFDGDLRVVVNHTSQFDPDTGISSYVRAAAKGVYTVVGTEGVIVGTKDKNGKRVYTAEFEDGYNTVTVTNAAGEVISEKFSLYGREVEFTLPEYGSYTVTAGYRSVYKITYIDKTFGLKIPQYAAEANDESALSAKIASIDNTVTHRFIGWSLTEDGTAPDYTGGETVTLTESMTLYSIWKSIPKYTVNFKAEDETDLGSMTAYPGKKIQFPDITAYVKYGFRVAGWAEKGSAEYIVSVPERNVTLYPVYEERTGEYRVVYLNGAAAENGSGISPEEPMNSVISAVEFLRETGGRIVVTGPTVFANNGKKAGCADYPVVTGLVFNNTGDITITSLDEDSGIDYRTAYDSSTKLLDENGAYIFYANGINGGQKNMTGRIKYENVVFDKAVATYINFDGHPLTLGGGIRVYNGTKSGGVTVGTLQVRGLGESGSVKSNPEGLDIEVSGLEVGTCEFNVGGAASTAVGGIKLVLLDDVNYSINLGANIGMLTLTGDLRINMYGKPRGFVTSKLEHESGNVLVLENAGVDAELDFAAPQGYVTKRVMTSALGSIDFIDGERDRVSVFCDLGYEYCDVYINEAELYDTVRFGKDFRAEVEVPDSRTYIIDYTNDPCFSITFDTGCETLKNRLWNSPTAEVFVPDGVYRYGYLFEGWSCDGKLYEPGDIYIMPDENVTFTAVWTNAPKITVTLDTNGHGNGGTVTDYIYERITLPTLSDTGAHFIGWALSDDAVTGFLYYELISDVTLYAVWDESDSVYSVKTAYSESEERAYIYVFLDGKAASEGTFAFTAGSMLRYNTGEITVAHGINAALVCDSANISVTWQADEREYDFFERQLLFTLSFDCKAEGDAPKNIESLAIMNGECSIDGEIRLCKAPTVKDNIKAFGKVVGTATVLRDIPETARSSAMLYITDSDGDIIYSERLEAPGNKKRSFAFDVTLPTGKYGMRIIKTGYLEKTITINVSDGTLTLSDQPLFGGDTGDNLGMGDGVIDAYDFIRIIRGFDPSFKRVKELDVNEDGVVNVLDLVVIKQMLMTSIDLSEYSVSTDDPTLYSCAKSCADVLSERSGVTVGADDGESAKRFVISCNKDYKLRNWTSSFSGTDTVTVVGGSEEALIHAFENIGDIATHRGNGMRENLPQSLSYDSNYDISTASFAGTELCKYSMVVPSEDDGLSGMIAEHINGYLADSYGYTLEVKTESTPDASEIHIGNTGYVDYPTLETEHCSITVSGNKVVVAYNGEYSAEIIAYDFTEQVISKYNPLFDSDTFGISIPDGYELLDNDTVSTKFLLMSDTHVESDFWEKDHEVYTLWKPNFEALTETYKYINRNFTVDELNFGLFCGDQLNTGYANNQKDLTDELENYYETLDILDLYRETKGKDVSSFMFSKTDGYNDADGKYKTFPELDSRIIAFQGNHDEGVPDFWRECSFVSGDTKFICFFASYIGLSAPEGKYRSTGFVSDETIEFIEKELENTDDSVNHVVLACHWSIVLDDKNFGWPILDACAENSYNGNRQRLLDLCEKYGADLYINGHEHNANYPIGKAGPLTDISIGSTTSHWAIVEIHKRKAVFDIYTRAYTDAEGNLTKEPEYVKTKKIDLVPRSILLRDDK